MLVLSEHLYNSKRSIIILDKQRFNFLEQNLFKIRTNNNFELMIFIKLEQANFCLNRLIARLNIIGQTGFAFSGLVIILSYKLP